MSRTYTVFYKDVSETQVVTAMGLKDIIEKRFHKHTPKSHNYIFQKIINSNIVFENTSFIITPLGAITETIRPSLPGVTAPKNRNLAIASRQNIDEWTVFNEKTGKFCVFYSLASLARAFDVSTSYLRDRVKFANGYQFGDLVITYNTTPEGLYYCDKLSEVYQDEPDTNLLSTQIEDIEFSVRAINCLRDANISTVGELIERRECDLMKTRNFGSRTLTEINNYLKSVGLQLKQ